MNIVRFLPRGMMARLALVLVAALALELAGNSVINHMQEQELVSEEQFRRVAEQLANADRIVAQVRPEQRSQLIAGLESQGISLNWVPRTVISNAGIGQPRLVRMRARLDASAPALAGRDLHLSVIPSRDGKHRDLLGALRLADGTFVTFRMSPFLDSPPSFATTTLLHLLLVAIVLGAALAMMWALVRPLGDLADAADATGRDRMPEIAVRGPWEVRRVAAAFRAMQQRLLKMVEDHTKALVAVSHDLRTPIQRLRLRVSLLRDEEAQASMAADLADMEKFIGSVIGFVQSGFEEDGRQIDLAAMAMTMADNACDAGFSVEYVGPDELPVFLPPLALKRALGNLIDNACSHASEVKVVVESGDPVVLLVEDNGPGIPPERREEAFLPFRRLHSGRTGEGGNSGLGLAIVEKAVAAFNGKVTLGESRMGGLAARIEIPATAPRGSH